MFKHVPNLIFEELDVVTTDDGRYYTTPEGNSYPSVTTILGKGTDKTQLENWKKRVGEEEAKKISTQASIRGEAVHEIAEQYLRNNPNYKKGHMPVNVASFNYIKPLLDKSIGLIAGLELPLYSDFLRVAGRVDCIAKWDGIWSIVDFKTSKRKKTKEQVFGYMCQEACYAYMFYERTGKPIPQIVTVMTVDDSEPLVFVDETRNFINDFIKIRKSVDL